MWAVSRVISGPWVRPVRNSAQPSGVEVSIGSASETRTFTVSPVEVVMGPPRDVATARARTPVRSAVPGAASIDLAYAGWIDGAVPEDGSKAVTTRAATRAAPETTMASGSILGGATSPL
jgi:hypothetical protein